MRVAASNDGSRLDRVRTVETPETFEAGMERFREVARQLADGKKIFGIAGGVAGPLDRKRGRILDVPQMPGWRQKDIRPELEEMFGCAAYVENDAIVGALGEAVYGSGKGYGIVVYITVSTGLGGARVVDGKVDAHSMGFEPGHQFIDVTRSIGGDASGRGTLIDYVSGMGIERWKGKKPEEIADKKFWDLEARLLAYGLNNTIVHWSPDTMVIGGSLMKKISLVAVREYLKEYLTIFGRVPILKKAKLGDHLGLYGALAYLKEMRNVEL